MNKNPWLGVLVSCLPASLLAQSPTDTIAAARKALGDVRSVTYSGSARDVSFQQCGANASAVICHGTHDPMRPITNYVRVIDLATPTTRHTGNTMNVGPGGSTTIGPGTFFQQVSAQQADVSQPWAQAVDFYLTPWGFLKGASENSTTVSRRKVDGANLTVLSWNPKVKAPSGKEYTINAYLGDDLLVQKVETWLGDNIMGDMHIVATYAGWRDFDGARVPTEIVQTRGGWPFFAAEVSNARGNPQELTTLAPEPPRPAGAPAGPPPGAGGAPPAMTVTTEKLGEGLWRLTTGAGSYDSLLVEFKTHVMVLEAGQSEARALAYIAEVKKLVPGKPIRYVMNTHPHADHTGGLPPFVAEGATLITHRNNQAFLERALNTPRTLLTDTLARNPKRAKVEPVDGKKVYTDGNRTVELYHIYPAPHSNGLLVAYIPKEKVLFQGDFSLPAAGQPANDHVKALVPALEKLGVTDFDRYINVHASAAPQSKAELWRAVGRTP